MYCLIFASRLSLRVNLLMSITYLIQPDEFTYQEAVADAGRSSDWVTLTICRWCLLCLDPSNAETKLPSSCKLRPFHSQIVEAQCSFHFLFASFFVPLLLFPSLVDS